MHYKWIAVPDTVIPRTENPLIQHLLDTYVSETNKVASVWKEFRDADLDFKIHPKFSSVAEIFRHQLLSERRFFAEFLGSPEPAPDQVLPAAMSVENAVNRLAELASARLGFLAGREVLWWMETVPFFDVERQRIWIFWRRVLHTTHHRTQLTVVLRLMGRDVPSTYGPTADVTWTGADPTYSTAAAGRK